MPVHSSSSEAFREMFIFETIQLIGKLEQIILNSEKCNNLDTHAIDEIFRIMHTIKGSSSMMFYKHIALVTHSVEDVFFYLRDEREKEFDCAKLTDIVLEVIDFIKVEITKLQDGQDLEGDPSILIQDIHGFLERLKNPSTAGTMLNPYEAVFNFVDGCEMENIRAFGIIHKLKDRAENIRHVPEDLIDDESSIGIIRKDGFKILFHSEGPQEEMYGFLQETLFIKDFTLRVIEKKVISLEEPIIDLLEKTPEKELRPDNQISTNKQSIISVSVTKLDKLMDLVGEMVISEAMVTQNPELADLELDSFHKASRQLKKITNELQDMVMSIRMVEISTTFHKLNRIVRDMSRKLNKEVQLQVIGEETEVDKNIIDHISDPLMHLIRNAIDHGLEHAEERKEQGKSEIGTITLEAKNAGSEVWITVRDDGRGLDKQKILKRARENGLIVRPESELTDKEIYAFIFFAGFSTNEQVTEYSGRGVGMDVVTKNIEALGGAVSVDSVQYKGTVITIKIPLTLAIIDGMTITVGGLKYTVPTTSIKQSFRITPAEVIRDPNNNEMILVRGQCHPIIRLHELFKVQTRITNLHEGIIMMVENDDNIVCLFADELIDKQQVVVKTMPSYFKKMNGIAGCTILGDGSISLILNTSDFFT
ncbi:MAG: chemotaxis protein CheA [Paenibacillaceae bacterium]